MPKQRILIIQEVVIEFNTLDDRKEVLKDLKNNPNCLSIGGGSGSFRKTGKPIKFIFPEKIKT